MKSKARQILKEMRSQVRQKTNDDERCPVCRKRIIYRLEPRHLDHCLTEHRLQYCSVCSTLVSIDSITQHMAALHGSSNPKKRAEEESIELDAFELAGSKKVLWKILPHGENRLQAIIRYFDEILYDSRKIDLVERQRLYDVYGLGADEIYVGEDEFDGYVVFVFLSRHMAVLESPFYGNATYVIWGAWRQLSRLSKSTLLSQHTGKVERVIHKDRWLSRLKALFR